MTKMENAEKQRVVYLDKQAPPQKPKMKAAQQRNLTARLLDTANAQTLATTSALERKYNPKPDVRKFTAEEQQEAVDKLYREQVTISLSPPRDCAVPAALCSTRFGLLL